MLCSQFQQSRLDTRNEDHECNFYADVTMIFHKIRLCEWALLQFDHDYNFDIAANTAQSPSLAFGREPSCSMSKSSNVLVLFIAVS